jgi:amino acid adenylation domain-containing protein
MRLDGLLHNAALNHAEKTAIVDPERGALSYRQLCDASGAIARRLRAAGVGSGDRVGICAPKSAGAVVALFGVLEADAAYVPVDPGAPTARSALIFEDCGVRAVVAHRPLLGHLREDLRNVRLEVIGEIAIEDIAPRDLVLVRIAGPRQAAAPRGLAYILYTSGSTGKPKGVMHSHATALSFVDWCSEEFAPGENDVFSSHAPFHFDLSIFDLFVSIKHAATLVLISEECGKQPRQLAALIAERRISIWYSTPSVLRLLVEFGKMTAFDESALRLVLYAGEVFPIKHQRALRALWPRPAYYNLYGPTETNVCTYDRVDSLPPDDSVRPISIGQACSGDRLRVVDGRGRDVRAGEEGELIVAGGSVMLGYWNLPDDDARAFLTDNDGVPWYKTGDMVVGDGSGRYLFRGRRDRMVKRRGYRVELGEIEAALHRHASISEAAVVALADADGGVIIKAFINWTGAAKPSVIELKGFAKQHLPAYMIPDRYEVLAALPRTSTDKIDYQRLQASI